MPDHHVHLYFMGKALEEAHAAYQQREVPVGAVAVLDDRIVGHGHNAVISRSDPVAHAEITALRAAGQYAHNYRLPDLNLYVTLEPCLMCYTAMVHARINHLFYAATDAKTGVFSTGCFDQVSHVFNHTVTVTPGILGEESASLLKRFFRELRGR